MTWRTILFEQFYKVIESIYLKTSSLSDLYLIWDLSLISDLYIIPTFCLISSTHNWLVQQLQLQELESLRTFVKKLGLFRNQHFHMKGKASPRARLEDIISYFAEKCHHKGVSLTLYKKMSVLLYIGRCQPYFVLENVNLAQCYKISAS